jgi:hypothetical protein
VGTLARLRLGHTINIRKAKGACRRRGSTTIAILLLHRKKGRVNPWVKRPVAALVVPQSLAAGRQISAPAARKMLQVLVLVLWLLLPVFLLRLIVLSSAILAECVLFRLRFWVPVLALGDVTLGRLEMGKGRAAGAAKVRPLARVRPGVNLQVTGPCCRIWAVGALERPLARVRPDVSL